MHVFPHEMLHKLRDFDPWPFRCMAHQLKLVIRCRLYLCILYTQMM